MQVRRGAGKQPPARKANAARGSKAQRSGVVARVSSAVSDFFSSVLGSNNAEETETKPETSATKPKRSPPSIHRGIGR